MEERDGGVKNDSKVIGLCRRVCVCVCVCVHVLTCHRQCGTAGEACELRKKEEALGHGV